MTQKILIGEDPRLRQKAAQVTPEELTRPEFQSMIDELFITMDQADGLGLAAPQVGIGKRLAIIVQGSEKLCIVNPKIVAHSKERVLGEEGCLSFPGLFGKVARYVSVNLEALDRQGKPIKLEATDMDARVIQHEIDHLDGVLLPDRLKEKEEAPTVTFEGRSL